MRKRFLEVPSSIKEKNTFLKLKKFNSGIPSNNLNSRQATSIQSEYFETMN